MKLQDGKLACFKAYDVRGRVPDELDTDLARYIGQAFAEVVHPRRVLVGHDIRLSSEAMSHALIEGLTRSGVEVYFLGLCGTEEVYFATSDLKLDGGIMVTASHNPVDYNGMKFVRQESRPISSDSGLREIEAAARAFANAKEVKGNSHPARVEPVNTREAYIKHLLSYVDLKELRPLKIVANAGNGCAGLAINALEQYLPFKFTKVHFELDGNFPNGVPNPLLPENRPSTIQAIKQTNADFGIAWDGDFDRCFLFDEQGNFIEGYYIVGLLAAQILQRYPGAKIIHDPRLIWNTVEMVREAGGIPVQCKSGHAFIKERMRSEDAVYGGEMSAHHYFKEFSYCDSGMIPWLLVAAAMSYSGKSLSTLVGERIRRYPASGEINRHVPNPSAAINSILDRYRGDAKSIDETDGVSVEFDDWRFNLRMSNTEPVVRLNVETRGDMALMHTQTDELLHALAEMGASA